MQRFFAFLEHPAGGEDLDSKRKNTAFFISHSFEPNLRIELLKKATSKNT